MRRGLITTFAVGAALSLAACGGSASDTASSAATAAGNASSHAASAAAPSTAPATASATASTTAPATTAAGGDLLSVMGTAAGVSLLPQAFGAAGLTQTLQGKGPYTVFAPTDAAFGTIPQATIQAAMADPQGKLKPILSYHVVSGTLTAKDLTAKNGQKIKTLAGATLTVKAAGGKVSLVDGSGKTVNVTKADTKASNGVLHTVDGVLMPTK